MGSAIPLSVFLGSVIRSYLVLTKIRFTVGNATGLKNPKNTRTGITDPSGKPEFYAYNEHIREVRSFAPKPHLLFCLDAKK